MQEIKKPKEIQQKKAKTNSSGLGPELPAPPVPAGTGYWLRRRSPRLFSPAPTRPLSQGVYAVKIKVARSPQASVEVPNRQHGYRAVVITFL